MPTVGFDAVGPGATGAGGTTGTATSPTTWSHTNNGNAIVVGVTIYNGSTNTVTSVTYGGVALTFLGFVPGDNQSAGGVAMYGKVGGLPTGANTVSVAFSDGANHNAGSISFTNAGGFGTAVTNFASATSVTASVANTVTGGMIAAAASYGGTSLNTFSGTNSVTVRWQHAGSTNTGADNGVGGTVPSTGGGAAQTVGFTDTGTDYWGIVAVEVQPATSTPVSSADTAHAAEHGSFPDRPSSFDSAAASPASSIHATLAGSDTGHAAEKGATTRYITGVSASGSSQAGHFTDNTGQPRLWVSTETWGLIVNAGAWTSGGSPADWQTEMSNFLSARAAQGFTMVMTDPIWTESSNTTSSNGNTWDGVTPFTGGSTDPSTATLNSAFWARVDYLLATAASYGISIGLVLFNTNATTLGKSWTNAQRQAWGALVGARYASTPNLVWLFGNDAFPSGDDATWPSIATGLASAGDSHPQIAWYMAEYTSRYETDNNLLAAWGSAHSAANFCYSYNAGYWVIEYAYGETSAPDNAASLLTPFWGDGYFYQGGTAYSATLDRAYRQECWWTLASGARGILFESEAVYPWGAASAVTNVTAEWFPSHNMANIVSFFTSLKNWHLLLPDRPSAFVTAGRGTRVSGFAAGGSGGQYEPAFTNSYVAAALTPAGDLALCYLPNHTVITVNTALLASGWAASWVDPVTGAATSAGAGPSFSSTAQGTNSQGDPDWVLVFQAATQAVSGSDSGHSAPAVKSVGVGPPVTARGWAS